MQYVGFPMYQVEDSTCLNPSRLISTLEFASKLVTAKRYRQWALDVPALPAYSPVINHGIGQSPTNEDVNGKNPVNGGFNGKIP